MFDESFAPESLWGRYARWANHRKQNRINNPYGHNTSSETNLHRNKSTEQIIRRIAIWTQWEKRTKLEITKVLSINYYIYILQSINNESTSIDHRYIVQHVLNISQLYVNIYQKLSDIKTKYIKIYQRTITLCWKYLIT